MSLDSSVPVIFDNAALLFRQFNEPGVTKDKFTVKMLIDGNVTSDTSLPQLLTIGSHTVKYNVTDLQGNSHQCSFFAIVKGQSYF